NDNLLKQNNLENSPNNFEKPFKETEDLYPSPFKNIVQPKSDKTPTSEDFIQLHNSFIIAQNENGFILIHQQNAHERILYERFTEALKGKPIATQRSLFPTAIELSAPDAVLLNELLPDLNILGYQV